MICALGQVRLGYIWYWVAPQSLGTAGTGPRGYGIYSILFLIHFNNKSMVSVFEWHFKGKLLLLLLHFCPDLKAHHDERLPSNILKLSN